MEMDKKLKAFVIATLRRASYRHPGRTIAKKNARVGRNQYHCAMCGPDKIYGSKEVQLDHINPIVPITGWDGWEGFISRLFCGAEGYQLLCKPHHSEKTKEENRKRKK